MKWGMHTMQRYRKIIGRTLWLLTILLPLASTRLAESAERIRWRSGAVRVAVQSDDQIQRVLTAVSATETTRHIVVQFDAPVSASQRVALAAAGVRLLGYVGDNAFFASVVPQRLDAMAAARIGSLIHAGPIERKWKLHPAFVTGSVPAWAVVDTGNPTPTVAAYVVFHRDMALVPDAVRVARKSGAIVRSHLNLVNALVVELPLSAVPTLADDDAVQWIEPPLPPMEEINDITRQITQAEIVQGPPYDLDGTGVTVLVYDTGAGDESHPDFGGRLTSRDGEGISGHSTHVACTVGGDGTASNGQFRGMAPNVTIESYGSLCCPPGFLYSDPLDIQQDYDEAINVYNADIGTNSIGTNVCRNGLNCDWTGDYGVTAQLIDTIVTGGLGRSFRIVWANGNERGCSRCRDEGVHTPEGYHSTAPPAGAKNHITVGALTDTETVAWFTSWGPTDDGRLKPDISAPGVGVVSCSPSGGYVSLSGTSMATPAVAGISALLLQDFRAQFPLLSDPLNSTLKILLAHTAVDIAQVGPDYQSGYGSVRIQDAIDFMRSNGGLNFLEGVAIQQSVFALSVRVNPGDTTLKVTLAWDDFPGTPNVDPALVNDLDLRVFDPGGAQFFPWTLDPANPAAPAVRTGFDHINNIVQVFVASPTPGLWQVQVFGFNVPEAPQRFSIAASPRLVFDCNGNDIPDDEEISADPSLDCSGNGVLDECEPDCDGDAIADSCEIFNGSSSDCDRNGVPDDCQPFADCNGNGTFDPCDITEGPAIDCNNNWIPDACLGLEADCNGNQVPDECDVAEGTSEDCNHNSVPDECEMIDCNLNGVLDACDIREGTSSDCNSNGVPDECEPERTVFVDDDGPFDPLFGDPTVSDPNEDGSGMHPFDAIQEGIDAAACGDTVLIRDGIYTGEGNKNLDTVGKSIRIKSSGNPEACVIDVQGDGRGFHFHNGEDATTRLEGVTIQNASFNDGSGIFCEGASPTIDNCIIRNGSAPAGGAGIRCFNGASPTISRCILADNTSGSGSGVHMMNSSNPVIDRCLFINNTASSGGAILANGGSTPVIINCQFIGNMANAGAAVYFSANIRPKITNCLFSGNTTLGHGGAIFATLSASPTITNTTFWGNNADRGGAVYCTTGCQATIQNSILWGDTAPDGREIVSSRAGSSVAVIRSDVQGGETAVLTEEGGTLNWSAGNLEIDPLFLDPAGPDTLRGTLDDNLRLALESPCVNAGRNDLVPEGITTDLDGNARIVDFDVDLGAYERGNFCGDGDCDVLEDLCSCPQDCGGVASEGIGPLCTDGIDNDCDGATDCADTECAAGPVCTCLIAQPPTTDGLGLKNRYVTFVDNNPGWLSAVRVTLSSIPPPLDAANGTTMWVGPPRVICENSGQSDPPPSGCGPAPGLADRTTTVATLQCDPYYDDWNRFGPVHVYHDVVVPGASFELQAIGSACDLLAEETYSTVLTAQTGLWGDVVKDCTTTPCGPADGNVDVITDVVSILNKFGNLPGAPIKARTDMEPANVDFKIQISDVLQSLSAFRGNGFPFMPDLVPPLCTAIRPGNK